MTDKLATDFGDPVFLSWMHSHMDHVDMDQIVL